MILFFIFLQEKAEEIMEDSEEGQRLRFLENEIHKTNLKLMEGDFDEESPFLHGL